MFVLSHELRLMLASADGDLTKTNNLLQQSINWDEFLLLTDHHRVYPLVYETLSRLDKPNVPDHILDVLRQKCRYNAIRAVNLTIEVVRIVSCFEKKCISAVVLKGAPLCWRLYENITTRPYHDIDILVARDKLEQATEILESEGYVRIYSVSVLSLRQLQIYLKGHSNDSHFMYWHSKKRIILEIHWKLSKFRNVLPFTAEGNIKKIMVEGNPLPVFSDQEYLFYLIFHGAGHGWFCLRWLIDIKKLIQQEKPDWIYLENMAKKFGMQSFLHQALILLKHILGVAIPPALEPVVARDKMARRLAGLSMKTLLLAIGEQASGAKRLYLFFLHKAYDKAYGLYMSKGLKNKFHYILKSLGPTVEEIKLIALPDRLYSLYYIIRPYNFFAQRLRRLFRL